LKRSNRLVLLVGVFLAVVAFVGIAVILGGNGGGGTPQASIATTLPTVIATQDIPLGVVVKAEMLTTQEKRIDTERKIGAFADPSQIIGQPTRRKIIAGAQLEAADFVDLGTVTRLDVPAGKLAMAIQVDQISGVGTLIKTGDYVDMIIGLAADAFPVVTLNPQDQSVTVVAGLNGTSVKLLLQGMQVLGTLLPPAPAAAQGAPAPGASGQPSSALTGGQELVLVAVDAQQAEVLKFAQMDGNVTLALRAAGDFVDPVTGAPLPPVSAVTTGVTLKVLVDSYGVLPPEVVQTVTPTATKKP
jgi:pilus assembly protein CpaB